jgi:spermidine/putrescine transport system permease protein
MTQVLEPETRETLPASATVTRRSRLTGGRVLHAYTWLVVAWLTLPVLIMILFGFNDTPGRYNQTWEGFTLKWYGRVFELDELTRALVTSLLVMFAAISSPELVMGASLLTLFVSLGVGLGAVTITIAHVMFCISFVAVLVRARVLTLDRSIEEAAADLGANPWTTFWRITFPMILPAVASGMMLAFALSIDDFVVTNFTAGTSTTFPLWIWGSTRVGLPPQVNVMGTLIFLAGVLIAVGASVRSRPHRPGPRASRRPAGRRG